MDEYDFFDCNCMLGSWMEDKGSSFSCIDELENYRNKYLISDVLVHHSLATYYNPQEGNRILAGLTHGVQSLKQCWVVMPSATGEFSAPSTVVHDLSINRVCSVRVFPKLHGYCLSVWAVDELFRSLEKMRMPVFLDYSLLHWSDGFDIDWNEIYALCNRYKELPVILVRMSIACNRNLYHLLSRFENLYFELSYYQVNRGIEHIVERFGAGHMLFGTGAPIFDPGCVISMLHFSRVGKNEKKLIAGDNFRRLVKEINYESV